jgi:hypothetical protein
MPALFPSAFFKEPHLQFLSCILYIPMGQDAEAGWETTTWDGNRRAQLRAALALTVRERLQALEDLAELAQRLAEMPRTPGTVTK